MARERHITYYKNDGSGTTLSCVHSGTGAVQLDPIDAVGEFWGETPQDWSRTAYAWVCWNTAEDGSGTSYGVGENPTGTQIVVYAIWQYQPYIEHKVSQGVINLLSQDQYEGATLSNTEFYIVNDGLEYELASNLYPAFEGSISTIVSPLYQLPSQTSFNGSSTYIDTGISILSTDQDFTIFLDFQYNSSTDRMSVMHCMNETSPWPGMTFNVYNSNFEAQYYGAKALAPYDTNRHKIIYVHTAGTTSACVLYFDSTTGMANTVDRAYSNISQHVLLGCYQASNGTKGRWFNGTLYDACIYDVVPSAEVIAGLMSQGSKNTPVTKMVPIDKDVYYPSAKAVYDAWVGESFDANNKYY